MKKILSSIVVLALMLAIMAAAGAEGQKEEEFQKFVKWQQAQTLGEAGDMYDELAASLKSIKALYDKGLVGTNRFRTAVGLMTGKKTDYMSSDKLIEAYDEVFPKIRRWFKEGDEVWNGLENFLKDAQKAAEENGKKWVTYNKETEVWTYYKTAYAAIAEGLGVSEEIVKIIFMKLRDFGWS